MGSGVNLEFLSGGGEMAARMRAHDWSGTPLGSPDSWPQSLRTVVRILLTSRYQMWMAWGEDLTFLYNDAYRPTLGVKHDWALGTPADQVWKEIWPDIGPRIERVLRTGEATWDEGLLLFLERSGYPEETYHTFSYSPLSDDSGAIVGMLCVVTEETDRVIGERRVASLRQLSSEMAGKNTQPSVLTAAEKVMEANRKDLPFTLLYLLDEDGNAQLAGSTGTAEGHLIAPTTIHAGDNSIWPLQAVLAGRTQLMLHDLRHVADVPRGAWDKPSTQAAIVPIARQGQDTLSGFLIAGINPCRKVDDDYRGFLSLIGGQIGSALANARAYEEERSRAEALAEIDRAKTVFFSNTSHEFRTPLTLMLGPLSDMLARKPVQGPILADATELESVHRNGVRLLKLVNTLLDFSRIEAGRVQARLEATDLAAFTSDLASTFQSAMQKAGLEFVVDCPPLPEKTLVDRGMWEKIVLNLLSNAFKYTLTGRVTVSLAQEGSNVRLTVRDTGVGIAAHELPRLFERFHRIEGQRGRTHEGTGIGLALVAELARLNGGAVSAESVLGEGSAIAVTVPQVAVQVPADASHDDGTDPSSAIGANAFVSEALRWLPGEEALPVDVADPSVWQQDGHGGAQIRPSVVLADDNLDMREYLGRLLGTHYDVKVFADGQAALDAIQMQRPDLVLSDVMMPRLDGFGLLRELRADEHLRDIPVILLSARAGEEASVDGFDAGADDYLIKPFSARELLARVRANIDLAKLRRESLLLQQELRAEAELARERSEAILASINDGFFVLNRDWRFTYVNPAAERLLGLSANDLLGRSHWEVYPRTKDTMVEAKFRAVMETRTSTAFENYYEPWGRWYDIRLYPSRDGSISVYFQDISDKKTTEASLQRLNETLEQQVEQRTIEVQNKEARLRTVFETSFIYQGALTPEGILLDANATSLMDIGAGLKDVIGHAFWETPWFSGTPGMSDEMRADIPRVAAGETVRREIRINLPVGGWRWFDFQMRPVRDANGAVIGIVPEAVELTQRRQAEEALLQAQKMEAVGQLTGGIAHDFNNLLAGITGSLELAKAKLPREQAATISRYMDAALGAASRAAALTQRLLAFSRRQTLDPKPVDLDRLVAGMTELIHRTIGPSIAMRVASGDVWPVLADPNQMENALLNLCINARDAMPDGGTLTIETSDVVLESAGGPIHDLSPGEYICLRVSDTGAGMTPDVMARAFDPFFTTKPLGQGTGLGLSMIYGFAQQSGGQVALRSEVGKGTCVEIYLPRYRGESSGEAAPAEEGAMQTSGRGQKILVVDDEPIIRMLVMEALESAYFKGVEAGDGASALKILQSEPDVELLITDVGLPGGINGRQLADAGRVTCPNLKVLFITGYAEKSVMGDGDLEMGMQILTKPFPIETLTHKLRDMLGTNQ
jgi:PAS domain S-box-containing protein